MTRRFHPENGRLKRRHLQYIREAKRQSQTSIDRIAAAIDRFQSHTNWKPFRKFHIEQAIAFKRRLEKDTNPRTGKPLSASMKRSTLAAIKGFFIWLADQQGFKSKISYSDCEYFNLDNRNVALANAVQPKSYASMTQLEHVLKLMPSSTPVEKRDRALFAFVMLTGTRVAALASAKISHVNIEEKEFYQNAIDVKTKFSKSFQTWFFPVSEKALRIFEAYYIWLTEQQLYGPSDPLFPATEIGYIESRGFGIIGLTRSHWKTTASIRKIFKSAFKAASLPGHNPHSVRDTLASIGKTRCTNHEQLQAWAQNLGHKDTTMIIHAYGSVSPERQKEIIARLRK